MESGRQYIKTKKNQNNILPDTSVYDIYKLKANEILLNSIGQTKIDQSIVKQGLIDTTQKGASYTLEIYDGSYFYSYNTIADMHAFRAFELFGSIEYTPLQTYFYEITIPEYFEDGYYLVDGFGFVRIVKGKEWNSENTNFNKQILYPEIPNNLLDKNNIDISEVVLDSILIKDMSNPESEDYVAPDLYSTYEPINKFKTNIPNVLGYVDPDVEDSEYDEEELELRNKLQESKVSKFNLWFPKGKNCMVTIQSPTMEAMGTIDVTIGNKVHNLSLDRLNGLYSTTFKGTDEVGVLTVRGLYNSYDIKLVNCSQATDEQIKGMNIDNKEEKEEDVEKSSIEESSDLEKNDENNTNSDSDDIVDTTKENDEDLEELTEEDN